MALFGSLGSALTGLTELARTAAPLATTAAAFAAPGAQAPLLQKVGAAGAALQSMPMAQQGQAVAIDQAMQTVPQETQGSGTITQDLRMLPGMGGAYGPLIDRFLGGARQMAPGVGGALAYEGGAQILDYLSGDSMRAGMAPIVNGRKLRVTRKMKSQVKQAVDLIGIEATAASMGVDNSVVLYILTHKLRNDGPYVTKAAVRKTKSTVKKLKAMCDMYDDLRPPAKRSAPTRRRTSSTTLIKN